MPPACSQIKHVHERHATNVYCRCSNSALLPMPDGCFKLGGASSHAGAERRRWHAMHAQRWRPVRPQPPHAIAADWGVRVSSSPISICYVPKPIQLQLPPAIG